MNDYIDNAMLQMNKLVNVGIDHSNLLEKYFSDVPPTQRSDIW